jgi:ribosomal protein L34E
VDHGKGARESTITLRLDRSRKERDQVRRVPGGFLKLARDRRHARLNSRKSCTEELEKALRTRYVLRRTEIETEKKKNPQQPASWRHVSLAQRGHAKLEEGLSWKSSANRVAPAGPKSLMRVSFQTRGCEQKWGTCTCVVNQERRKQTLLLATVQTREGQRLISWLICVHFHCVVVFIWGKYRVAIVQSARRSALA